MKKAILLIMLFVSLSCNKTAEESESQNPSEPSTHIQHFGFTLIDTYWDDPTDSEEKTNYLDEVHSFSNLADILVVNPTDDLLDRINAMAEVEVKVVFHLHELFFELVGTNDLSGSDYSLRSDYKSRWDDFVTLNQLMNNADKIGAFYIGEEPTWNGISFEDLKDATDYVRGQFPDTPIMVIEAYPVIDNLQIPSSVDWIGFDHYFIKNPNTDSDFQMEWQQIKSKLTNLNQKLVVILDSHYIDIAHGDFGNIALDEMKEVTQNYYDLAKSDSSVIAIIGYFWPNGFDLPQSIGARGMPQEVIDEYTKIGEEITGK